MSLFNLKQSFIGVAKVLRNPAKKPVDHSKAINAHRLERDHGGAWSNYATTADHFQDHYYTAGDGSIWRPRDGATRYYSTASGKLMMVCTQPKP